MKARVRLVLTNERGETVFNVVEDVSKWIWSGTPPEDPVFVYLKGNETSRVGADGGWGTYADIRSDGRYKLLFENVAPDPNTKSLGVHLVAVGGGWK